MICPKCNTENEETNMLCKTCGSILKKDEVDKQTGNTTTTPFSVHNEEASRVIKNNQIQENNKVIEKNFAKKYVRYKIIKTLITILILVGIGFLGKKGYDYYFDFISDMDRPIFIEDDKEHFAAFSTRGKKLTEYIFSEVEDESSLYTLVKRSTDNRYLILGIDGKFTIDDVDYLDIKRVYVDSFLATKKDGTSALIDGEGRVLLEGNISLINGEPNMLLGETKDEYTVYNFKGEKIYSLDKTEDDEKINATVDNGLVSIYYHGKCYFLNMKELITSIDSPIPLYAFYYNDEYLLLNENTYTNCSMEAYTNCIASYTTYRLIDKEGNDIELKDREGIYENEKSYLTFSYGESKKIYSKDFKVLVDNYDEFIFIDDTHYAYELDNKVIIKHKEEEEVIDDSELIPSKKYYIIKNKNNYYLLDKDNNKVSSDMDLIEFIEQENSIFFKIYSSDKKGILDEELNLLTDEMHKEIEVVETIRGTVLKITDDKTYLLDVSKNMKLGNFDNIKELRYDMFITETKESIEYHSYLKLFKFHSEKIKK